jgi:hypothetical protein
MDDFERLGKMLAKPGPSPDVVDRGRRRLQQETRRPARRRGIGRLSGGLGLAAAAMAAAVAAAILTAPTTPSRSTAPDSPPAETRMSGRQILLAAAVNAESRESGSGTYWHVKIVHRFQVKGNAPPVPVLPGHRVLPSPPSETTSESWIRRDGQAWTPQGLPGTVSKAEGIGLLDETDVSFTQIQGLPTDPVALKAWIVDLLKRYRKNWKNPVRVTDSDVRALLAELLYQAPAPPKVRAAAFRAIASYPNVKSLGRFEGGQGLAILAGGSPLELVVDPTTSLVRSMSVQSPNVTETTVIVTAEWTDLLPKVVPPSSVPFPPVPAG